MRLPLVWVGFGVPAGHRDHEILSGLASLSEWHVASCECGFTERCASRGAAEGALQAHLRAARPWEHYAGRVPCAGTGGDTHRVLTPEEATAHVGDTAGTPATF